MLSYSAEICKQIDADSFKMSGGVFTCHCHYIVTRSRAPVHRRGETVPVCRRTNLRIYDKVKRSQEEMPKRDAQSASIEENQDSVEGNNDSFTQGRDNERQKRER